MFRWFRDQVQVLLTAVMFYTRIPCPPWVDHSEDLLNRATVYFPVIGWIAGLLAAGVYALALFVWSPWVAVLLSLLATLWMTGAFHEDGLADVCDAFGGGWSREQILTILKDSRLGTYGVVGLTLALGLKVALLASLPSGAFFPAVMVGHTLSRAFAASFTYWLPYAREEADYGKAKPLAKGMPLTRLLTLLALGVLPLGLLPFGWLWLAPLALVPVGVYLYRLYRRWLGGYTGDCLGAAQQLGELALYLALAALPWF